MSDKFPTEQEHQYRKLLKEIEELKEIASSIPILMREPRESAPKHWIKKVLPKPVAGYTCALYRVAGVIIFIVLTPVKFDSAYRFDKPYIDESVVFVQQFTKYAKFQLASAEIPRLPSLPSSPTPWNPPAIPGSIAGGNRSNSTSQSYILSAASGTNAGGVTGSRVWFMSDDGSIKET
jgi:hypothetical protein